jgi:hypothetical protein
MLGKFSFFFGNFMSSCHNNCYVCYCEICCYNCRLEWRYVMFYIVLIIFTRDNTAIQKLTLSRIDEPCSDVQCFLPP